MDANGTRFHLVLGEQDWLGDSSAPVSLAAPAGIEWDPDTGSVRLSRLAFVFPDRKSETPPSLGDRRGLAADRFDNCYWISDSRTEIRFLAGGATKSEHFWSPGDGLGGRSAPVSPAGFEPVEAAAAPEIRMSALTVTTDHYLLAGLLQPVGLLVFDLAGGGSPLLLLWPPGIPFVPFDMAALPDGGAVILDRRNRRYWRLDREFRVIRLAAAAAATVPGAFEPLAAPSLLPGPCEAGELAEGFSIPLAGVEDPIAIDATGDGRVLVLDLAPSSSRSAVHCFDWAVRAAGCILPELPGQPGRTIRAHDMAFVPSTSFLFVVDGAGNQSFAYRVELKPAALVLTTEPAFYPMREFSGKGLGRRGNQLFYDFFGDRIAPLVVQPKPRYALSGTIELPAGKPDQILCFDGKEPGCVWHRLFMDAVIPPGAGVAIESRAGDDKRQLTAAAWRREPDPVLRRTGAELPYFRTDLQGPTSGTYELLFQSATGRYLQLRLTLAGTGRNTPLVRALRVYYPRFSYLKAYLPAVYREEGNSAWLLDRYLANVEGFYTALEDRITHVEGFFDTRIVPAEYLEWLAGWMGVALDATWSESTRRLFLAHARQMFDERGTHSGVIRSLRLALDPCPDRSLFEGPAEQVSRFPLRIVERFLTRRAPGVVFGDPTDLLGPGSTTDLYTWTAAKGGQALDDRFRAWLSQRYAAVEALNAAWGAAYSGFDDPALRLPAVKPSSGARAADWVRFIRLDLGFTYTPVASEDAPLYRDFLARRYGQPKELNLLYALTGSSRLESWDETKTKLWDVWLPYSLPPDGPMLSDWIQFVSVALPRARNAHKFSVLVPVTLADSLEEQARKRDIAKRVTSLAKPAHTDYDVKLYWAMFRVGEARVGLETLLGKGGRSVPMIAGRDYLATGHLGYAPPWSVTRRWVTGRDAAGREVSAQTEENCQ